MPLRVVLGHAGRCPPPPPQNLPARSTCRPCCVPWIPSVHHRVLLALVFLPLPLASGPEVGESPGGALPLCPRIPAVPGCEKCHPFLSAQEKLPEDRFPDGQASRAGGALCGGSGSIFVLPSCCLVGSSGIHGRMVRQRGKAHGFMLCGDPGVVEPCAHSWALHREQRSPGSVQISGPSEMLSQRAKY